MTISWVVSDARSSLPPGHENKTQPRATYITPSPVPWFDLLPAEVTVLSADPGLLDLQSVITKSGIVSDIILQNELYARYISLK